MKEMGDGMEAQMEGIGRRLDVLERRVRNDIPTPGFNHGTDRPDPSAASTKTLHEETGGSRDRGLEQNLPGISGTPGWNRRGKMKSS
jgi:hypothetical protein